MFGWLGKTPGAAFFQLMPILQWRFFNEEKIKKKNDFLGIMGCLGVWPKITWDREFFPFPQATRGLFSGGKILKPKKILDILGCLGGKNPVSTAFFSICPFTQGVVFPRKIQKKKTYF